MFRVWSYDSVQLCLVIQKCWLSEIQIQSTITLSEVMTSSQAVQYNFISGVQSVRRTSLAGSERYLWSVLIGKHWATRWCHCGAVGVDLSINTLAEYTVV